MTTQTRKARKRHLASPFSRFAAAVEKVIAVEQQKAKQQAARKLIAAGKLCGYETLDGLIGEVGVPRRREDGGRVWRAKRRK